MRKKPQLRQLDNLNIFSYLIGTDLSQGESMRPKRHELIELLKAPVEYWEANFKRRPGNIQATIGVFFYPRLQMAKQALRDQKKGVRRIRRQELVELLGVYAVFFQTGFECENNVVKTKKDRTYWDWLQKTKRALREEKRYLQRNNVHMIACGPREIQRYK